MRSRFLGLLAGDNDIMVRRPKVMRDAPWTVGVGLEVALSHVTCSVTRLDQVEVRSSTSPSTQIWVAKGHAYRIHREYEDFS